MKYQKYDTTNLSTLDVYFKVLKGEFSKFPNGFLDKRSCKEILRYVCLEELKLTREQICKINYAFLKKHYMASFKKPFGESVAKLVIFSFPELDIKIWETYKVTANFWTKKENQKEFITWIAKKENIDLQNPSEILKITAQVIDRHGGSKARQFAGGVYELITAATGKKFKEWEICKIEVWTKEKAVKAIKWLIEEKLKWSDEEIQNLLSVSTFRKNNLGGMLKNYCNNSPIVAINLAYPGKFKKLKYTKFSKKLS